MRILFDYRPALRGRTGVGEYAHGLAAALQGLLAPGESLALFSSSWKDRLGNPLPGAGRVDARIPVRALNLAWHRLQWPPVEWLAGGVDVVHAQHPLLIPARGAQFVTIHDLFFLDAPEQTRAEIRRDYARLAGIHARRADAVVVSSEYTRRKVIDRLAVDPARIILCPAGAPPWTARAAPPVGGGCILFVGTAEPRKNLAGLLAAYTLLVQDWPAAPPLVLAGHLPAGAAASLHASLPSAVRPRVQLLGYVDDARKRRLYDEALMLVIPSFDEGFGLTALEAMAAGVPVVAARRGSLPEVLGDAAIFVDATRSASIAEGLGSVAADAALQRRLAEAGVRRAAGFRWEPGAERVLAAYREAVSRRRGR